MVNLWTMVSLLLLLLLFGVMLRDAFAHHVVRHVWRRQQLLNQYQTRIHTYSYELCNHTP